MTEPLSEPTDAQPTDAEPTDADLATAAARTLAGWVRTRRCPAERVVAVHVERLRAADERLNVVAAARYEAALQEARALDARIARGEVEQLGPLAGVPFTVKENLSLQGMPLTAGLVARRGERAERDGTAVARLRAAGAIPLAVTNVSELCMWMEADNRLYGRTANAYDPRRTAGGSSGGEGAAVGSGAVPFGLGADIGGSIRMPAFFNGVFGHKASPGAVPLGGHYPLPTGEAQRMLSVGPLCRRAEDLPLLLEVLTGPSPEDPTARRTLRLQPEQVRLAELRVLDVPDDGHTPVHPVLRAAQRRAARHLQARGARVEQTRLAPLRHVLPLWTAVMHASADRTFAEFLAEGTGEPSIRLLPELWRLARGRSTHTGASLGLAVVEKLAAPLDGLMRRAPARLARLRARLLGALQGGVMLYPSYPIPAPRHGEPLRHPAWWVYTAAVNVFGLCATQVPLGLGPDGLPLGVQVVGPPGSDEVTLAVAAELERAFGGWREPAWQRA